MKNCCEVFSSISNAFMKLDLMLQFGFCILPLGDFGGDLTCLWLFTKDPCSAVETGKGFCLSCEKWCRVASPLGGGSSALFPAAYDDFSGSKEKQ